MRGYLFLRITAWLLTIASGLGSLLAVIGEWSHLCRMVDYSSYALYLDRIIDLRSATLLKGLIFLLAIASRIRKFPGRTLACLGISLSIVDLLFALWQDMIPDHLPAEFQSFSLQMVFIGALWLDRWAARSRGPDLLDCSGDRPAAAAQAIGPDEPRSGT